MLLPEKITIYCKKRFDVANKDKNDSLKLLDDLLGKAAAVGADEDPEAKVGAFSPCQMLALTQSLGIGKRHAFDDHGVGGGLGGTR